LNQLAYEFSPAPLVAPAAVIDVTEDAPADKVDPQKNQSIACGATPFTMFP